MNRTFPVWGLIAFVVIAVVLSYPLRRKYAATHPWNLRTRVLGWLVGAGIAFLIWGLWR